MTVARRADFWHRLTDLLCTDSIYLLYILDIGSMLYQTLRLIMCLVHRSDEKIPHVSIAVLGDLYAVFEVEKI